jgi:methanogenic corrinoid protein MtbC1
MQGLQRRYVAALVDGETRAARAVIERAAAEGTPVERLYLEVLQPAMQEIGDRWERGEVGVAQEHLATAVTSAVLAWLSAGLPGAGGAHGHAIVCCTPGERHALGGRMVADFLAAEGWDVDHHGEAMTLEAIVGSVQVSGAELVALSTAQTSLLPEARRVCVALKALRRTPHVAVGGRAYRGDPRVAELVGADTFAADPRGLLAQLAHAVT